MEDHIKGSVVSFNRDGQAVPPVRECFDLTIRDKNFATFHFYPPGKFSPGVKPVPLPGV
ncbi:hypothetical protein BCEN4_60004 [Burkholderia cenocepacia]|nr:hypothetical protein BCEN4_60004 [Burkholderia cenocepacia]